jgi:hypothetical protein
MANMSYCRFENTNTDLADCVKALEGVIYDHEEISEREWRCAKIMKDWCERYLEVFDDLEEDELIIYK